ncbi:MAG: site-specific integrase, partial [Betaproteobacteria bacterium]|nr:site-specific integrase [Betaproteobacteria bacterium]
MTDDELSRLLAEAQKRGRDAWYLAAAFAGLRKGDLERLIWADVNFKESTLTIREGKAKRVDVIPMHPQLADALQRRLQANPALPTTRVWSASVGNLTRQKDFKRAGIDLVDAQGRVVDLHALRATLATQLARASVTPQVAQRILRHSDYRTTLKHYTMLGLVDTAAAIAKLPFVKPTPSESLRATGTTDISPVSGCMPYCVQLGSETVRNSASQRTTSAARHECDAKEKSPQTQGYS